MTRWSGRRATRARARLAPLVASGRAVCRRCGEPIKPGQAWDVGHVLDIGRGGSLDGPVAPEHALKADCPAGGNRAAGGRLVHELRAAPTRSRRLADWLRIFPAAHPRGSSPPPVFLPRTPHGLSHPRRKIYGPNVIGAKA